jgi:Xaa-Pro aminopeptidase
MWMLPGERFSAAEMTRRMALARALMLERELGALVVFGTSANNGAAMANTFWLSNYLDLHQCYLVVPFEEGREPALYVGLRNHLPNAREVSDVPLVEWGGYDPAATIAARLRELGIERGRVGIVGVNAKFAIGMPYSHYLRLRQALSGVELPDVTAPFQRLRAVKSEEEIARLYKAAALTDKAMLAIAERARPGTSEIELVAAAEAAYRSEGAMPRITFLRSMAMDAPSGCVPAQMASRRRLRAGDVIITEVSASYGGYTGQIHRPIFVDAEPAGEWRRMFDVAKEAYLAVADAMRPGASEADIIRAADPIRQAGYGIYDDLVHGYGVDILAPVIDRDRFRQPSGNGGERLRRNMAIVIQPNPVAADERTGLQLGALTVVREAGANSLHRVPLEPMIATSR